MYSREQTHLVCGLVSMIRPALMIRPVLMIRPALIIRVVSIKGGKSMAISYERLWRRLDSEGISKTEFRKLVDISTVTLSKLSKNEEVSLSIMEKICRTFQCRIEDILEIITEKKEEKWSRINDDILYIAELFYIEDDDQIPVFLYGYSVAGNEGMEGGKRAGVSVRLQKGELKIWKVSLAVNGENLRSLIRRIEQKNNWGEFLNECSFELHTDHREREVKERITAFSEVLIGSRNLNYRPPIILIPEMESGELIRECQPLHSFDEDAMVSESLVCSGKQELYKDKSGSLDTAKMRLIRQFFHEERLLINGMKDLQRIGDFEVFYPLIDNARQDELFQIESVTEKNGVLSKSIAGFKITVFAAHLSGKYALEIITSNAGNPTLYKQFDLLIEGKDILRTVEVPESSGGIEVRLLDKNEERTIQLVGYRKVSLIRDIHILFHEQERHITLEDKYTKKAVSQLKKEQKTAVNTAVKSYSSFESKIEDKGSDPWRREFEQVREDFDKLYGKDEAESIFFENGMLSHEAFLNWLKEKINMQQVKSVWIFDPYIDAASVPGILRLLQDRGTSLKIITDGKAASRVQGDRILQLKKVCKGMEPLLTEKLEIYAFSGKKSVLHDRTVLLFGEGYFPKVYNLSNSLDNIGIYSPSVVCSLERETGQQVAEYYLDLYQKMSDGGETEEIWKADNDSNRKKLYSTAIPQEIVEESLEKTVSLFNLRLKESQLPEFYVEEKRIRLPESVSEQEKERIIQIVCCNAGKEWEPLVCLHSNTDPIFGWGLKKYLRNHYNPEWSDELKKAVLRSFEEVTEGEEKIRKQILKVRPGGEFRDLLKEMEYVRDHYVEYRWSKTAARMSWVGEMALEMLIINDFSVYLSLFQELKKSDSWDDLRKKRRLIVKLAEVLAEAEDREQSCELAKMCLESELEELIALGIQWFAKTGEAEPAAGILKKTGYCHELFREMLIDLQVKDCRKNYRSAERNIPAREDTQQFEEEKKEFLQQMEGVKEAWVSYCPGGMTSKEMDNYFSGLKQRSLEDICDLLILLNKNKKAAQEETEAYINKLLFIKLIEDYKHEDGNWRGKDFTDGGTLLYMMAEYGTEKGRDETLKQLAVWERKLIKTLHDVFLCRKNYSKWKCCIDMLIWCRVMRGVCEKNWEDYGKLTEKDSGVLVREREIQGLLKKYKSILEDNSEAYRILMDNI